MKIIPRSLLPAGSMLAIGATLFLSPCHSFAETKAKTPAKTPDKSSKRVITLDEAYDRTMASDQSVRIAYLEIRKANLLPWSALTKLTPRLTGGYTFNHTETKTSPTFDVPGEMSSIGAQNTNLTLQQTLIDFTFFPAYRLAKLTGFSARLQYQLTIRNVLFGLAKAYYEVLKQKKIVALDAETVQLSEKQLQLSQNQYEAGQVSKVDVLRGQSTLESARQSLISDQNLLALDHDVLANTLNLQGDMRDFDVAQPEDAPEDIDSFEKNLTAAMTNREDYKVSAISVQQNIEQRNEVIGQYAPSVAAQFSKNWAQTTDQPHEDSWDAIISVQVPFFTGGQREIDLRTARHNIDEAKLTLETTSKNVEIDVKTTWLQVETLRQTIQSLKAEVAANEQNYQDLVNQYQDGAATSLDTQTGLIQLVTSRTNLIAQTYQYQVALRDLQRSIALFQNKRVKSARLP